MAAGRFYRFFQVYRQTSLGRTPRSTGPVSSFFIDSSLVLKTGTLFNKYLSDVSGSKEEYHPNLKTTDLTETNAVSPNTSGVPHSNSGAVGDPPFDTHEVFRTLKQSGFTESQSESLLLLLRNTIATSIQRQDQPIRSDVKLMIEILRKEISSIAHVLDLLEKTQILSLRTQTDDMKIQIKSLKEMFQEEMVKVKSGISLDFNLEKSRIREEASQLNQAIRDTQNRIGTSVAELRTQIEAQKLELIKYLAGGIATIFTLMLSVVLGMWRLSK